jgi:hypothetical protein
VIVVLGYSAKAHCTGKPSYLKPNSQTMQKKGRGRVQPSAQKNTNIFEA